MIIEQEVGTFNGYDVIIRREVGNFREEENQKDFERTADYLREHIFNRIDHQLQEDFEDLLKYKVVLDKIKDILIDEWTRYNEKHNPPEEEEQ